MKTTRVPLTALTARPASTPLTDDQVRRITAFHVTFAEVFPGSLDKALDDFRQDENPDREIAIWEAMASEFTEKSEGLGPAARQRLFSRILSKSLTSDPILVRPQPS